METIRAEISQLVDQVDACRQQYTEAGNTVARASRWQFQSLRDAASRARQEQAESATNGLIHQQLLVQELGNANVKELPPRIIQALEFQFTGASMPEIENEVNALRAAFFSGRAAPLTPVQRAPPKPTIAKKQGLLDGWVSTSAPKDLPEKQKQPVLLKTPTAGTARLTPPTPATLSRPQSSSVSLSKGPTNIAKPVVPAKRRQDPESEERSPLAPIDGNRRKSARVSKLPAKNHGVERSPLDLIDGSLSHKNEISHDDDDDEFEESAICDPEVVEEYSDVPANLDDLDDAETAQKPWTDDRGLIHVGGQPLEPVPLVLSAPMQIAETRIRLSVTNNYRVTDEKFINMTKALSTTHSARLKDYLVQTLRERRDGHVEVICDYTGLPLSWSPGPRAFSLEALHRFVVMGGQSMYHAYPNVVLVMDWLNKAKHTWPVVVPALMGAAARLNKTKVDFATLKAKWTWLYNALTNAMILSVIFKLRQNHNDSIKENESWTKEKMRGCLEALRTGSYSPTIDRELKGKALSQIFQHRGYRGSRPKTSSIDWATVYKQLLSVAKKHGGLSPSEFDFYLTIPNPRGKGRVFYPYHIMTRPLVIYMKWDWLTIYSIAIHMAKTATKSCNRAAEKAGLGENLDGLKVIFGLCAIMSKAIKQLKVNWPTAGQDEIAFRLLECWGFPLVPFKQHPQHASLGHEVHGTAMYFGFTNLPDEEFDPERHIDLDRCTVSLETQFTNKAKWNFHNDYYEDMQDYLSKTPLQHPYYRVDLTMGNKIWSSHLPNEVQPQAPEPEFETELLPIELWVPEGDEVQEIPPPRLDCHECDLSLCSAGALIQHYREAHGTNELLHEHVDTDQEEIDAKYWARFTCNTCGKLHSTLQTLHIHEQIHLPDDERDKHMCQTCGQMFLTYASMIRHREVHVADDDMDKRTYRCNIDGCAKAYVTVSRLTQHMRESHGERIYTCDFEGCEAAFTIKSRLDSHREIHNAKKDSFMYDVPGCGKGFTSKSGLSLHTTAAHSERKHHCDHDGCDKSFSFQRDLKRHKKQHGPRERNFVCDVCGKAFYSKVDLGRHKKDVHSGKPYHCDVEGCDGKFSTKTNLKAHKKQFH